ncbi:hypothetical protein H072_6869 [Dactylellina haptotyla CBS 200.50]|uniref:Tropomyosin n=1 Tax=Dactylellina haptotyla (strain CBS 200.50) TaxID=1284197 RepID=S8BJ98_DACHA|nr:hypothetical protein H072_6869 [Dactylellina haptotyla CBS 200.50]
MDRIKEKLNSLSAKVEEKDLKIQELEKKIKDLEADFLSKDQAVSSLTHRNTTLEADVEKLEEQLSAAKKEALEGAQHGTTSDNLQRKVTVLEEETENLEKQLKETVEKLRVTDVKAEHYERKVTAAEADRDLWEQKYEKECQEHKNTKKELDDLAISLEGI